MQKRLKEDLSVLSNTHVEFANILTQQLPRWIQQQAENILEFRKLYLMHAENLEKELSDFNSGEELTKVEKEEYGNFLGKIFNINQNFKKKIDEFQFLLFKEPQEQDFLKKYAELETFINQYKTSHTILVEMIKKRVNPKNAEKAKSIIDKLNDQILNMEKIVRKAIPENKPNESASTDVKDAKEKTAPPLTTLYSATHQHLAALNRSRYMQSCN